MHKSFAKEYRIADVLQIAYRKAVALASIRLQHPTPGLSYLIFLIRAGTRHHCEVPPQLLQLLEAARNGGIEQTPLPSCFV